MATLLLGGVLITVYLLSKSEATMLVVGGLVFVVDFLLFFFLSSSHPEQFEIRLMPQTSSSGATCVVGGRLFLQLCMKSKKTHSRAMLTPLMPESFVPCRTSALTGAVNVGEEVTSTFEYVLTEPGSFVIPGLKVCCASPLWLFTRTLVIPHRVELTVMPDPMLTASPRLMRIMQRLAAVDHGRFAIKRSGNDFHELREYRYPDSVRRIDWKATARRNNLMVREYETRRDLSIRILLDGSLDLTRRSAWFVNTLEFIGHLTRLAASFRLPLSVDAYDQGLLHRFRFGTGATGGQRLLAELGALPRMALLRTVNRHAHQSKVNEMAQQVAAAMGWKLPRGDETRFREALQDRLASGTTSTQSSLAEFLVDFVPARVGALVDRCPECGGVVFADEARCASCKRPLGSANLPPRAACVAGWLAELHRTTHGREIVLVISALQGGEACDTIADLLCLTQRGFRTIHVIVPNIATLSSHRPRSPGYIGSQPTRREMMYNMDKLYTAECFMNFRRRLEGGDVALHRIDDRTVLDEVIETIIMNELHLGAQAGTG